jgi:aminoglycoside phosphotransferase (APT) family kinase protein
MSPDLDGRIARYLGARWGTPVEVSGLRRFHGGAARETFRFDASSARGVQGLVLRRDPSSTLIQTSRAVEFHALGRAFAAGLPAPEPLYLEEGDFAFGAAGFIMTEVAEGRAAGLFDIDPYGAHAAATGAALFGTMGRLHALPVTPADRIALPEGGAAARLRHWQRTLQQHSSRAQPVAAAALRWLAAHCPPDPAVPAIIHGDCRSGNVLVAGDGRLSAVLDWEMAHIGDPMEDLAWAMDPLWAHGERDGAASAGRVAAMLPMADAIAAWQAASGRVFDSAHWNWWRLFAGTAGLVIWINSADEVANFRTVDPVMAFAGYYPYRYHSAMVAALLAELHGDPAT